MVPQLLGLSDKKIAQRHRERIRAEEQITDLMLLLSRNTVSLIVGYLLGMEGKQECTVFAYN